MLLTLEDIAEIKKQATTIEAGIAIATDCLTRSMEALTALRDAALHDEVRAFYINAGMKPKE
jgi:hypothetical protein